MGIIRRYRTAIKRHHRSAGFGIHSPHAFNFVTNVLRGRLPYYAYDDIATLRQHVIDASKSNWPHPRIISFKNAKLLFRIVNNFNPQEILQIGTCYGVSSACALAVDSKSHITLYEPNIDVYPPTQEVFEKLGNRVTRHDTLEVSLNDYSTLLDNQAPFIIVNNLPDEKQDYNTLLEWIKPHLTNECVVIMRNLARHDHMKRLWNDCKTAATGGQTFTNEKIAIIVATPKLQREDFFLWF
ncbi:MAG: hypothetical protein J6S96_03455 [Muribaculaceae bacterium]|nr:hypothetical protein [Muribaculaceae bacterium]